MNDADRLLAWRTLAWAFALFALNALICRELFFTEYTKHLGSIEAAYIGIGRYLLDHPFEFGWFPLWYCGIPYQNTYPPLLHMAVAAKAWIAGISPALAYHSLTALLYCLGPVTVFLLAVEFSRKRMAGLLAGLAYSLVSPSLLFVEQMGWAGPLSNPVRLQFLVESGEGPHIASLTLLPLAVLALHYALKRRTPGPIYLAAAALAAVVLTNWLGAVALAVAVLSYLCARSNEPDRGRTTALACLVGAIAYALAAPWIPPSTLGAIRHNAQHVIGQYPMTPYHLLYAAAIAAAVMLLRRLFGRLRIPLILSFSAFLSFFFATLVLTYDRFGIALMPQPLRYGLEMDMAFCLLAVFTCVHLARQPRSKLKPHPKLKLCAAAAAALAALLQFANYRGRARDLIEPIDMTRSIEYQASTRLRESLPGARVFATGSVQFWLNAFTDNPQIGGGFGQGIVNRQIPIVHFGIPWTRNDGANSALWLRLYGAQAVLVSGPEGRDFYKQDWRDPAKFAGVLPELWRDGGDVIYAVPGRSASLAHVILPEHVVERPPVNNSDLAPVQPLAAALEDASLPLAAFTWQNPRQALISAALAKQHLLFVQVAYHPGWRAAVGGEPRAIRKDGLGFMTIEPRCEGPCEVTLTYDGGLEMQLAKLLAGLTAFGGLLWFLQARRLSSPW